MITMMIIISLILNNMANKEPKHMKEFNVKREPKHMAESV